MTQPETSKPIPVSDPEPTAPANGDAEGAEPEPPPEPEPWTPERVSEWNAYYDLYVMLGVLLLAFIASANRITHSAVWTQLRVGQIIAATGRPVTTDVLSYTEEGKPWVNIPWAFELAHAQLYRVAKDLSPVDANDPVASAVRADQIGAGALVALDALVRLLTALTLMRIRRDGPGLWWSAVCVVLAVGAIFSPAGLVLGGIAGPGNVTPGTWGLLMLALELWLLHRAIYQGRRGARVALFLLFVLWANVDETFLIGLLVLAAVAVGRVRPAPDEHAGALTFPQALALLAACVAGCAVNPSHVAVFGAAARPLLALFRQSNDVITLDQLSYFGQRIRQPDQAGDAWPRLLAYYVILVSLGYLSFVLNRRRFSLSRFLAYTFMVVLWGALIRYAPEFSLLLAVTLALNGQEWFQDRFGTAGRVGLGWSFFSVGGRFVTILAVFAFITKALTGYGAAYGEPQFGFGYDPGDFAFEAADVLKTAPIHGNVLNTNLTQGDALVWRAYPERKTYNDSRQYLFPPEVLKKRQDARRALSEDDVEGWKPLLDEFKVSVVMLDPSRDTRTYRVLSQSPNWVAFHDDGNVVLFGRTDAAPGDVAYFNANRLDSTTMAYKRAKAAPSPERPPTPITWMDSIFRSRALASPQPHTESARRWLSPPSADPNVASLPEPARCLLAIREARTALASKPDDTVAYRRLADAYRYLMLQENALLQGVALTPENLAAIGQLSPRPDLFKLRFRQRLASLHYAVQTTPPPADELARHDLQALNLELSQLFLSANMVDMAHDRLQAVLEGSKPLDFSAEFKTQLSQQLAQLNEQVKQIQDQLSSLQNDQQYTPIQLASVAINQGAPGIAIHELEEAERTGVSPTLVRPQLLDLYCDTGQPDKAVEMLGAGAAEDSSFGTDPGLSALRQGRAYFLMGNSEYASTLWDRYAIPRLRQDRASRALSATQGYTRGEAKGATEALLEIPDKIVQQANWEFDSALCRLEGGAPEQAAEHFTKVLILAPKFTLRPVAAYYLEKLGKPVPPVPPASGTTPAATPAPAAATPASAAVTPATAAPKPKPEDEKKATPAPPPTTPAPKPEAPKEKAEPKKA